jgi:hypothetical protein
MTDVGAWLDEVSFAMGGSFTEQQAVRDELRAHIDAEVRELTLQGVPADDAVARALRDLGEPQQLGRALRASRGTHPLRRPLMQPAGAVAIGHRRMFRLPRASLLAAFAVAALAYGIVLAVYLWPS